MTLADALDKHGKSKKNDKALEDRGRDKVTGPGRNGNPGEKVKAKRGHRSSRTAKKVADESSSEGLGEFERAEAAAQFIFSLSALRPKIALVLGSGLGALAHEFADSVKTSYANIPFFPQTTAIGHAGQLILGKIGDVAIVGMQGRIHLYEGYSAKEVAFPMRVFARMGIRVVILTSASGGIKREFLPGCLVVVKDHINLQGVNPLSGPNDDRFGPRFPDMGVVYNKRLREMTVGEGNRLGLNMFEGVYAAVSGPNYETPAEIRYFRGMGADLVGMSMAAEAIAANHGGMRVLGVSCVTNTAAGILDHTLNHDEVLQTADRAKGHFTVLLKSIIPKISDYIG
jgi:purine-nucleoside phosphorylase